MTMTIPKDVPNLPPSGRDIQTPKAKDSQTDNAYSIPPLERRMSSENIGKAIKISNYREAQTQAPSLIGRVTKGFINFLHTPFIALGRLLGIEKNKEDLSFYVDPSDISELENQTKAKTDGVATNAKIILDNARHSAITELRKLADHIARLKATNDLGELPEQHLQKSIIEYKEKMESHINILSAGILSADDPKVILEKLELAKNSLTTIYRGVFDEAETKERKAALNNANAKLYFANEMSSAINLAASENSSIINADLKKNFDIQLNMFKSLCNVLKKDIDNLNASDLKIRLDSLDEAYRLLNQTFNGFDPEFLRQFNTREYQK